ncbi:hypothetical protein FisN_8Hh053 [Fistulifera solaris]|uniref:Uncharacterized protein n=1 Tax=Fistulifera solaris TaxID=1519565 RepID=A0A1Z5JK11_FISSO|nr:hypothetical protein FisN_8Hh053 [Fistulifera solaris]|eukprot:GAX14111.1 hypothetical protein FisN_8Hh053 [Fistulifera solaris]
MHRTISLFIVQKCWFSGPHTFDPIDCQRLLVTPESAQILAYQSAHAFAETIKQPVRTVPMPHAITYGFAVAGALFWIRKVDAAVVGSYSSPNNQYDAYTLCWNETVGDSRRRVQQEEHPSSTSLYVFVGDGARQVAQQHAAHDPHWTIRNMPIGPAPNDWRCEWPRNAVGLLENPTTVTASGKRTNTLEQDKMQSWHAVVTEQPAKRRCTGSPTSTTDHSMNWEA